MNKNLMEAALVGLAFQRGKVQEQIAALQARLGVRPAHRAVEGKRPRRKMSAAARKRIAAAQKARWKKFHAEQAGKK